MSQELNIFDSPENGVIYTALSHRDCLTGSCITKIVTILAANSTLIWRIEKRYSLGPILAHPK